MSKFSIQNFSHNRKLLYSVKLYNITGQSMIDLNPDGIHTLMIEDDIFSMYHSGYIIIKNNEDAIFRATEVAKPGDKTQTIKPFSLASNTRDLLVVEIANDVNNEAVPKMPKSHPAKLDFVFCIVETEDLHIGKDKYKKFTFIENENQYLNEYVPMFSTAHGGYGGLVDKIVSNNPLTTKHITKRSNADRSLYTGEAIIKCIMDTLKYYGQSAEVGYVDKGASKIFFSSPSDMNAAKVIQYIKEYHVSKDDDGNHSPCIFWKDRTAKTYNIKPICKFFEDARKPGFFSDSYGPTNIEHLTIAGPSGGATSKGIPPSPKTPSKKSTFTFNVFSVIDKYTFTVPNGMDVNQLYNDRVVYTYDHKKGQFGIHTKDGKIKKSAKDAQTLYHSKMKGKSGGGKSVLNTLPGQQQYINTWSFASGVGTKAFGENKNLMIELFLGPTMQFSLIGVPSRRTGRFVGIDREVQTKDNPFDNMILGQHFIVNVKHVFSGHEYTNEITTVKPYKYS